MMFAASGTTLASTTFEVPASTSLFSDIPRGGGMGHGGPGSAHGSGHGGGYGYGSNGSFSDGDGGLAGMREPSRSRAMVGNILEASVHDINGGARGAVGTVGTVGTAGGGAGSSGALSTASSGGGSGGTGKSKSGSTKAKCGITHITALHVLPLRRMVLVGTQDGQVMSCV